jgi:hypothetical protein
MHQEQNIWTSSLSTSFRLKVAKRHFSMPNLAKKRKTSHPFTIFTPTIGIFQAPQILSIKERP